MERRRPETREIRAIAETIRHELRAFEGQGGSSASFLPRVRRAHRYLRRRELEKALAVLHGIDDDLRERL